MKTVLTICILFASILFSSVIARELAQSGTGQTGNDHNNPAARERGTGNPKAPIKCDPNSPAYKSCVAQPEPKAKCHPNSAFSRCPGTGTSPTGKNPVNPPVKPGTGKGGNRNNPVVKPGTGQPTNPNDPGYKRGKPDPKNKCINGPYKRCNPPEEP